MDNNTANFDELLGAAMIAAESAPRPQARPRPILHNTAKSPGRPVVYNDPTNPLHFAKIALRCKIILWDSMLSEWVLQNKTQYLKAVEASSATVLNAVLDTVDGEECLLVG